MQWFGESWNAPVCETVEHARTPVGQLCFQCNKAIRESDRGLLIPLAGDGEPLIYPWHLRCFLQAVGVDTAKRKKPVEA